MSGLVFVRDAQGRPLMPMSAAYARTLIRQGKAHIWPHPAFSVIQLTRVVATPTLRPILVGLALNAATADLIVVIDQVRTSPSVIHLVIDLRSRPSLKRGRRKVWSFIGGYRRSARPSIPWSPFDQANVIAHTILACQTILPISHLMLLASQRASALPSSVAVGQRVIAQIRRRAENMTIMYSDREPAAPVHRPLVRVLTEIVAHPDREYAPMVVCIAAAHWRNSERIDLSNRRWGSRDRQVERKIPKRSIPYPRRLCTIRQRGRTTTGILLTRNAPDQLTLRVPTQVNDQGVQWRTIEIIADPPPHLWAPSPVLMLPLYTLEAPTVLRG